MKGHDVKDLLKGLAKFKLIAWLVGTIGPYLALLMAIVLIGGAVVATVAAIADKAEGIFHGVTSVVKLPGDLIDSLTGTDVDEKIKHELDCSNASKADRKAGTCISGLLDMGEAEQSPVPDDKAWLLPVWQAAATKYKIPWELVAAVNAARTNFGDNNCLSEHGDGFYRIYPDAWDQYKFDGGTAKTEDDGRCRESTQPAKLKPAAGKDVFDAVDATFTEARLLAEAGAKDEDDWEYAGSDPGACVTNTAKEGKVFVMPAFTGGGTGNGDVGFNARLDIDRDLAEQAAKYVHPLSLKGIPMPESAARKMLVEVWMAFGSPRHTAENNARLNMQQVFTESSYAPNQLQKIDDTNSRRGTPAQGLFQFVPSTFESWKVPGYDDILNPLDQIIAAVNAQKNGTQPILDGHSGWTPSGVNPYLNTNGSSTPGAAGGASTSTGPKAYEGDEQTDAISVAVAYNGPGAPNNSACYVALVHEWFVGIRNNPPLGDITAGGVRGRIVKIIQNEAQLGLAETPSGCNCGAPATRYEFPPGPQSPWCAYFTTWVWRKAGVNIPHYGLVSDVMNWGKQHNLFKPRTAVPQPGDAIIYGPSGNSHVGIVERVVGTKVTQVQFTTVEGNYSQKVARVGPTDVAHTGQYTYGFVSPARGGGSGINPLENPILPQGEDGHGSIQ